MQQQPKTLESKSQEPAQVITMPKTLIAKISDAELDSSSLPYIKPIQQLTLDKAGGTYSDETLGIVINIPEGAIEEHNQTVLYVGMCLYGPFTFPQDSAPIAPVLMLHPKQSISLLKPIRVTMPHMLDQANDYDIKPLGIKVIKAAHDHTPTTDEARDFIFKDLNQEECCISLTSRGDKSFASFSLLHFCFITLRATTSREVAKRRGYCICPLYPIQVLPNTTATFHLIVTYYMDPWLEVRIVLSH